MENNTLCSKYATLCGTISMYSRVIDGKNDTLW